MASGAPDFQAIFEAEIDYAYATLRRLGVAERDLADVAQELFVTVHRLLDDYDPTRPIRPWIFGIAYRIVLRHRRQAKHAREVLDDDVDDVDLAPLADVAIERAETRELVRAAIQQVELTRRSVLVLGDLEGVPIPQVAETLGIPLNTAYSRLRRARADFARAVLRLRAEEGRP